MSARRKSAGKVTVLAGGVGAARLLRGLAALVPARDLTVVVNTADDDVFHGLYVSPDIDTIVYTLAGMSDPARGWGIDGDGFRAIESLGTYGVETWFRLGDRDLATHLFRSEELRKGRSLADVTEAQRRALGVGVRVLPMTNAVVKTTIETARGRLSFQEYLVRDRARPRVRRVRYAGIEKARPAPGVVDSFRNADLIVIAPSNPFVSIGPILAVPGIRQALGRRRAPIVGVSPLIGGRPVKGPADRMMRAAGLRPEPASLVQLYEGILDGLVIDVSDRGAVRSLEAQGIGVVAVETLMSTPARSASVARAVLDLGASLRVSKKR